MEGVVPDGAFLAAAFFLCALVCSMSTFLVFYGAAVEPEIGVEMFHAPTAQLGWLDEVLSGVEIEGGRVGGGAWTKE